MIGGIFRYVQGIVRLRGGTDLTTIGNDGDRLRVSAITNLAPEEDVIYEFQDLADETTGLIINQNVNGSIVNVNFQYLPLSGVYYLENINFLIGDVGQNNSGNYGAINGGLTNGCLLTIKSNGIVYTLKTFKNNTELTMFFVSSAIAIPAGAWLEDIDTYRGGVEFKFPAVLDSAQGDYVRMTVRDNLTALSQQRMQLRIWKNV